MDRLGIGLIGYGMIGRVHALAYHELGLYYPGALPPIDLAAVCTTRAETAQRAAAEAGFRTWTTDVDELLKRDDVAVVDCCVPNYLHRPVLMAAILAGKPVIVEKPLALNTNEASEIAAAARRARVRIGLIFNFRFIPAITRAKQLIEEGFLGETYHFQIEYLHSGYQNPDRPMGWKLRRAQSGGGALTDLGAHLLDMTRYLLGEFDQVLASTRTYTTERPSSPGSTQRERVDVDDAAWVQARLASGAFGTVMATRYATGAVDDLNLLIHGQRGALRFQMMEPNWLYVYDQQAAGDPLGGKRGWTRVESIQQYPGSPVPPARSFIGWTRPLAHNLFSFLSAVTRNADPVPGLEDGLRVHQILDAAYASAESGQWVKVVL
jgi:levoglucosan dehydrogenase